MYITYHIIIIIVRDKRQYINEKINGCASKIGRNICKLFVAAERKWRENKKMKKKKIQCLKITTYPKLIVHAIKHSSHNIIIRDSEREWKRETIPLALAWECKFYCCFGSFGNNRRSKKKFFSFFLVNTFCLCFSFKNLLLWFLASV